MVKEINLFFSYYYRDQNDYDRIVKLLEEKGYFVFKNYSLDEDSDASNEEYIKSKIRPQIDKSSRIVVLIGPGTYSRKYVNYEIEYAARKEKRIVGVFLRGESDSRLPRALRELRNSNYVNLALVKWNTDKIIAAIRDTNYWEE